MVRTELQTSTPGSGLIEVHVEVHGLSDVGKVRTRNEDQYLVASLHKSMDVLEASSRPSLDARGPGRHRGHLFAVADGVGGHPGGDQASKLAIDTVVESLEGVARLDLRDELIGLPRKCLEAIQAEGSRVPEHRGMGTTLTLAYVLWPHLHVVHVGDSRCYHLNSTRFEQVTTDHTRAQQLVDIGLIEPEEIERSPLRHVLWNAIGGTVSDVVPEVQERKLRIGDTVVLCTDGLSSHLDDARIVEILAMSNSARESTEKLIEAALEAGGQDNITVVVAEFL